MFHYFGTVTNTRGDSLTGWRLQVYDDGGIVPIYSDNGITRLPNDQAVSDRQGNVDFYVADGVYDLRYYDTSNELQRTLADVPMRALTDYPTSPFDLPISTEEQDALDAISAKLVSGVGVAASTAATGSALAAPATATIYASQLGAKADGTTDDTEALRSAIQAARVLSQNLVGYYVEVVLPAGIIRTTAPIVVQNNTDSIKFRLRGAGRESTTILADFFTTDPAPQFTLSGGGGSGAVLYPIIEFGLLKAVIIISGGTGYASAPTATLVAPAGSGAAVTLTVSGGRVTAASVTNSGTGYTGNFAGDAIVCRGRCSEVSDLTILASPSRKAAGNGGNSAYPYFTTNNGLRIEPFTGQPASSLNTFATAIELGSTSRISVSDQPGHGVNAGRVEQWLFNQVFTSSNGADGFFVHIQGAAPGAYSIANKMLLCRASFNGARGINAVGVNMLNIDGGAVFNNQKAVSLPVGVNEDVLLDQCDAPNLYIDVEREGGNSTGKDLIKLAGCTAPKVGGYLRGGRRGVNCAAVRSPIFDNLEHFGNVGDSSDCILFFDGGTGNLASTAPCLGGVVNRGNVDLTVNRDSASIYLNGVERGVLFFGGLRGSRFPTTQSGNYALNYFNGCDQTITLTGNVNFTNPTVNGAGVRLRLKLVQDATGGRTPTFGTAFVNVGSLGSGTSSQFGILDLDCTIEAGRTVWVRTGWTGWL